MGDYLQIQFPVISPFSDPIMQNNSYELLSQKLLSNSVGIAFSNIAFRFADLFVILDRLHTDRLLYPRGQRQIPAADISSKPANDFLWDGLIAFKIPQSVESLSGSY